MSSINPLVRNAYGLDILNKGVTDHPVPVGQVLGFSERSSGYGSSTTALGALSWAGGFPPLSKKEVIPGVLPS